jgi:hypothetical protein
MASITALSACFQATKHLTDGMFSPVDRTDVDLYPPTPEQVRFSAADCTNTAVGSLFSWVASHLRTNAFAPAASTESDPAAACAENLDAALMRAVREDLRSAIVQGLIDSRAVATCLRVAEALSAILRLIPDAKFAAFAEDEGASLLIHSKSAKRQVTFEVSPDGRTIHVVTIDEQMRRTEYFAARADDLRVRESVAWLRRQP